MPSRRALLAGVGAASAGLAGCSDLLGGLDDVVDGGAREVPGDWTPAPGEWHGRYYDQANSGHNPHASPPPTEPTVAWEDEWGRSGGVLVAEGTVFLRETETLRGLDAEEGTEQFAVSRPSGGLHRYVDGRLYEVLTDDGIDALTLDGESEWDDPIHYDDPVLRMIERDGYVFLSTGTGTIHHHDADTGERVDATVHDPTVGGLENHDGVLYAALGDGLVAYDVDDGGGLVERWRHSVDVDANVDPISVSVGSDLAYVRQRRQRGADVGDAVLLFDVDAAEHVDTVEFDHTAAVSAIGGYTYVTVVQRTGRPPNEGEIRAYDGTDERWSVEFDTAPVRLVLADEVLYVCLLGGGSGLAALDAASGDELWRLDGMFPRAVVGETVYATTPDDRFVALRA